MSDEIKKGRGPTCPKHTLEQAVGYAKVLFDRASRAKIKPVVAVGALGYSGLNGAAATTLASLNQYGLIEKDSGDSMFISDHAVKILHALNDSQKIAALRESALMPKVFAELYEGGFNKSDETLISKHLIQNGFGQDAAVKAANVFLANNSFSKLDTESINISEVKQTDRKSTQETVPKGTANDALVAAMAALRHPQYNNPAAQAALGGHSSEASIPIGDDKFARVPFPMSEEDFDMFIETLKLWKRRLVQAPKQAPTNPTWPEPPFVATWKNKHSDTIVKIVAFMGEKDGRTFYQSEDGTGIPADELFQNKN